MAVLQSCLLLFVAMFANAASRKSTLEIKVLESETRALSPDDNGVPKDCDQITFDAYCRSSTAAKMVHTLLVQEGNQPPIRIACTQESKLSKCTPLPRGETFEAKRDKHGITVYYIDDKGKARSQLYTLVDSGGKPVPSATGATVTAQAVPSAAPQQNASALAPKQSSTAVVPAPPSVSAQGGISQKVKCSFSSTPPGAEITVDWRYVGNTPSEIGLGTGTHVVVISMPGFAEWKRELTVAADSAVNVTATLQKVQP
ncbi:MAG: PEGA domain-containing protein [Bryobacteraceae bacterium]